MTNAGGELVYVGGVVSHSGRYVVLDCELLGYRGKEIAADIQVPEALDGLRREERPTLVLKVLLPLPLK